MSFASQVKAFTEKAKKNPVKAQRQIFIELSNRVIQRTPVDTGRARANWQPSIGSPNTVTTEATDKTGNTVNAAVMSTAQAAHGADLYLTNSLPYIERLEDGWSDQAPQGMVKLSAQEFEPITKIVLRGMK